MGINTWRVTEESYNKDLNKSFEGLFAQGNGYLSMRGSFEEDLTDASQNDRYWRMPANVTLEKQRNPKSKWGVYVPGIVGNHPILNEEMVNLPYILGLNIYMDGARFDMEKSTYEGFSRELNLRNALLTRKFIWLQDNHKVEMNFSRYASMKRKNIIVQQVRIKSLKTDVNIKVEAFIETDVTTNGYNHFDIKEVLYGGGMIQCRIKTDLGDEVVMMSKLVLPSNSVKNFNIRHDRINSEGVLSLLKGEEVVINKISIVKTSKDKGTGSLLEDAAEELNRTVNELDKLYNEHVEEWEKKWAFSDIEIEGDEKSQLALRFSIYHLLRCVNENDDRVAIDAKGAAGEAYFGHYFWDTEIYLLPFYLYTNHAAARNLLMFRVNTLDGAKKNAAQYGYSGAKFPWESSISGAEQCSNWQYKDLEVHISADITYGMWNYYRVTGDKDTLFNHFIDVMYEVSRFWTERAGREKNGTYSIKGVMGPDEYLAFTNNNAFTNYMVRFCLRKTLETLDMIRNYDAKLYVEKKQKLNITEDELMLMEEITEKLNIPFDYEKHFIWQCDDFDNFEDVDLKKIWVDRSKPFGQFISQERNYRTKALKQADVIGLLYLFNRDFDEETVKNCMDYYEPITTHDSSLSYIIHSIVYSQLGNSSRAYEYFEKSLGIDLYDNGAAEGIHIANCGGIWQAVVFGFCGLNNMMFESEVKFKPCLPESWKRVKFRLVYNDKWYNIEVDKEKVEIN
jgi:kojibiose phosphorylase